MPKYIWIVLAVIAATLVYWLYKRKATADKSVLSLDDYMMQVFKKPKGV
jgi:lipopolysaccharide export system protein LptC